MSRIDKALRRTTGAPGEPDQAVFEPAWDAGSVPPRPAEGVPDQQLLDARGGPPQTEISLSSTWRERLASGADGDPALVEQFRRLAATLHQAHIANGIRSVMITSAQPGDGKTLTAVNLAIVLAESYRYNVLLMDADLRRPSIPNVFDAGRGAGLSEALVSTAPQKLGLVALTPRLTLLPAGQAIANSIEALTSPRMRLILDEALGRFDWIVLDAPPVGQTADAHLLANMVEGTLFVVHAGRTQHEDVQKGIDALGKEQILGVVLNGVETDGRESYYYYAAGSGQAG